MLDSLRWPTWLPERNGSMHIRGMLRSAVRRLNWLQHRSGWRPASNALRNALAFALKRDQAAPLPSLVKIDISPQCHLACTHCLHANPEGRNRPLLSAQSFGKKDAMSFERYASIIDQLRGKVLAVSLFYYGDPLIHPEVDRMIAYARAAGLAVHLTTHFSYRFTEERIRRLVEAGPSHLTVAVDGATQASYGRTRIGGKLDLVLKNLEMITAYKRLLKLDLPYIEVQHIRFAHHAPDEARRVRSMVTAMGVDGFSSFDGLRFDDSGDLYNVVDDDSQTEDHGPARPTGPLPRCHWPYSSTVIKSDGDVIPCCLWRVGRQYVPGERSHAVGNVFDTPLERIWSSPAYQRLRSVVSNPDAQRASGSFCDGCPKLYLPSGTMGERPAKSSSEPSTAPTFRPEREPVSLEPMPKKRSRSGW